MQDNHAAWIETLQRVMDIAVHLVPFVESVDEYDIEVNVWELLKEGVGGQMVGSVCVGIWIDGYLDWAVDVIERRTIQGTDFQV